MKLVVAVNYKMATGRFLIALKIEGKIRILINNFNFILQQQQRILNAPFNSFIIFYHN